MKRRAGTTEGGRWESAYTYVFCMSRSGRMIPDEKMAPADLAVP